jgi:hypothetical protein
LACWAEQGGACRTRGQIDLAAAPAEQKEAPKNREELRSLADPLTKLLRPRVGLLHLGRAAALDGHERTPERDLKGDFLLGSLGSIRLGPEQIESSGQCATASRAALRCVAILPAARK